MKQEKLDNIKVKVLAEKIRESVENGSLEKNMSVFRMEAANIGLTDIDVQELVKEAERVLTEKEHTRVFMEKHKIAFYIVVIAIIIAEWFCPISIGWKILLSILTVFAAIIIMAFLYLKRKNNFHNQ